MKPLIIADGFKRQLGFTESLEVNQTRIGSFQNYINNSNKFDDWISNYGSPSVTATNKENPFGLNNASEFTYIGSSSFLRSIADATINPGTTYKLSIYLRLVSGSNYVRVLLKSFATENKLFCYMTDKWQRFSGEIVAGDSYYLSIESDASTTFEVYGLQVEDSNNLSPYIPVNYAIPVRQNGVFSDRILTSSLFFNDGSQMYSESGILKYKDPTGTIKTVNLT